MKVYQNQMCWSITSKGQKTSMIVNVSSAVKWDIFKNTVEQAQTINTSFKMFKTRRRRIIGIISRRLNEEIFRMALSKAEGVHSTSSVVKWDIR